MPFLNRPICPYVLEGWTLLGFADPFFEARMDWGFGLHPEEREQCYTSFKNYLIKQGFRVYPTEFLCYPSEHPFVDIAAKMGDYFWAFEYKSTNDSISRGVEQLRAYSEWFDLVVLVSERSVQHSKSGNYWKLKEIGAGLWNYDPNRAQSLVQKSNPVIQKPMIRNKRLVSRRFRALSYGKKTSLEEAKWRQTVLPSFKSAEPI